MRERLHALIDRAPRDLLATALSDPRSVLGGAFGAIIVALALALGIGLGTRGPAFVIESADGHPFAVEVRGSGDDWVLLGHMWPTDRDTWNILEERLLDEGYRVMSWDFRCHGQTACAYSGKRVDDVPDVYREWEAAIDYARAEGADDIFGIGASMGGTSLMQVAAYRPEFRAVAAISSPNVFPNKLPENYRDGRLDGLATVDQINVPKLYIVGARNRCAYLYSDKFWQQSSGQSRLVVYESDLHGTTLIDDPDFRADAQSEIVEFLRNPEGLMGKEQRNDAPDADPQTECESDD